MKSNQFFKQSYIAVMNLSLIFLFLLYILPLHAQTPTNFSGKWELDKSASSTGIIESDYEGTLTLVITQYPNAITFSDIWSKTGEADFHTAVDSFTLDGKKIIRKDRIGTTKKSAKWSQDKKVLTTTYVDTQPLKGTPRDFLVKETYKLSDDGQTLTVENYSKNPVEGETTKKKVYHKK